MNLLSEMVERERRADDLREAKREREKRELLERGRDKPESKSKKKQVKDALGSKLVEWGEQLQEKPSPRPSTSKI